MTCDVQDDSKSIVQTNRVPMKRMITLMDRTGKAFQDHFFVRYRFHENRRLKNFSLDLHVSNLGENKAPSSLTEVYKVQMLPRNSMEVSILVPPPRIHLLRGK